MLEQGLVRRAVINKKDEQGAKLVATLVHQPSIGFAEGYLSTESLTRLLVFFLPIGAAIVPHWESSIFTLLSCSSIYFLAVNRGESVLNLRKDEKILFWCMILYFLVFLGTSLVNFEWGRKQNIYLGVEVRFLFFVPIYLMLRGVHGLTSMLLKGVVVSGGFLGVIALFEIYVLGKTVADGGFFSLYFGSLAALFLSLIVFSDFLKGENRFWRVSSVLSGGLLLEAAILSGARMAYLAIVASVLAWSFLSFRKGKLLAVLLLLSASVIAIYSSSGIMQGKVGLTIETLSDYFSDDQELSKKASQSSTGIRLEMWRTSILIIQENPWLGVGRGGYQPAAQQYVDEGMVSSSAAIHSQPHNAFFEMLVSRGMVGLTVFLAALFFPLYVFLKNYKNAPYVSMIGIGFVICITALSLTESMVFLRGKFVSMYLVCLACCFAGVFDQEVSKGTGKELPQH